VQGFPQCRGYLAPWRLVIFHTKLLNQNDSVLKYFARWWCSVDHNDGQFQREAVFQALAVPSQNRRRPVPMATYCVPSLDRDKKPDQLAKKLLSAVAIHFSRASHVQHNDSCAAATAPHHQTISGVSCQRCHRPEHSAGGNPRLARRERRGQKHVDEDHLRRGST
jgi:hypothetical protein